MKRALGVFNTDTVNLGGMKFTASALMQSYEDNLREAHADQMVAGVPSTIQHDLDRPYGWANILGQYIDGEMVRTLGFIEIPEDRDERDSMSDRHELYWNRYHKKEAEPFRDELVAKTGELSKKGLDCFRAEAVFARAQGLAAKLYPDFFDPKSNIVDKDGLVFFQ